MATVDELIQEGINQVKMGNKIAARRAFSQCVRQDQKNGRAWYYLSQVVEKQEESIYCLERVLEIQPGNRQALERLQSLKPAEPIIETQDAPAEIADEDLILMTAQGVNGSIELLEYKIRIKRSGVLAFMTQGIKGDKEILISQIAAIQFKKPGITNGYIQFSFLGGAEFKGALFQATQDENTVMFEVTQYETFALLKKEIEKRMSSSARPPMASLSSAADEIEKLASLKDRGILTESEFQLKKAELLRINSTPSIIHKPTHSSSSSSPVSSLPVQPKEKVSQSTKPASSVVSDSNSNSSVKKAPLWSYALITIIIICCVCGGLALVGGDASNYPSTSNLDDKVPVSGTPVEFSGRGAYATNPMTLPSKISKVTFSHKGKSNFAVYAYYGNEKDLLINEIGNYQGTVLVMTEDAVTFNIEADGSWTAKISGIGTVESSNFTGTGDNVSEFFNPPQRGPWEISHNGRSNFAVWYHCIGGSDLIVNEIGNYSGSTIISFDKGPCFWEVNADGSWSILPR